MIVKVLTEHHLEFLSLKGGCRGSFESTLVKMSNCWKSHARLKLFAITCMSDIPLSVGSSDDVIFDGWYSFGKDNPQPFHRSR